MISPEHERHDVILRLTDAVNLLEGSMDPRLIPSTGTNIVYAIRGARDSMDVAAVQGGIVALEGRVRPAGPCAFDAGGELSRIVLTTIKFDPAMRSAAAIRFSGSAFAVIEDMFLERCAVDHARETSGISTMDWGIAACCSDGVPEIIYDRGTASHEALIRLIGEDPVEVANNIIILSNRIQ